MLASLLVWRSPEHSARISEKNITLAKVASGIFHDYIPLRARVTPLSIVYLDAQAGGRVERVLVQAGDSVTQGQLLLELSNSQWELDVLEREARLVESVSQLESYQTQLEQNRIANQRSLAQIEYDVVRLRRSLARRKVLAVNSLEPAEKLDQIEDELNFDLKIQPLQDESNRRQEELRGEQIPEIREQLLKLQQDLRMTHAQLDKLTVRAPIGGQLTALSAQVGENRSAGERFGEITPHDGFKLSASIDEYYLGKVETGQDAGVTIRDHLFALKVSRVYPQVKGGLFQVDLSFIGAVPSDLTSGENVEGRLTLGADHSALLLSNGPFLDQTGGDWIFVINAEGHTAERRPIRLGRRNATQLEVLDGLKAGDAVVISTYEGLVALNRLELTR